MVWMLEDTTNSFQFRSIDLVEQNMLTNEELDTLEKIGDKVETQKAAVGFMEGEVIPDTRDTDINWLDVVEHEWFYRRLTDVINTTNEWIYKLDLTYMEKLQYSIYNEGQHYKSHVDMMDRVSPDKHHRKLSFSLQLTDENAYEGGDLLYFTGIDDNGVAMSRKRGVINFFPSYALHKVTPITKGQRRCIVGWANGPRFK